MILDEDVTTYKYKKRQIHQMFSRFLSTIFSQFEQLKKKINFLLVQNSIVCQFASWKRNQGKYSINNRILIIQDWWNYLMNSLKVIDFYLVFFLFSEDDNYWECFARHLTMSMYHPTGNEVYILGHVLSGPSMKHDWVKINSFSIILCPKI